MNLEKLIESELNLDTSKFYNPEFLRRERKNAEYQGLLKVFGIRDVFSTRFFGKGLQRTYTKEQIAQILLQNSLVENKDSAFKDADKLIASGITNTHTNEDSRGNVDSFSYGYLFAPYENLNGKIIYKLEYHDRAYLYGI